MSCSYLIFDTCRQFIPLQTPIITDSPVLNTKSLKVCIHDKLPWTLVQLNAVTQKSCRIQAHNDTPESINSIWRNCTIDCMTSTDQSCGDRNQRSQNLDKDWQRLWLTLQLIWILQHFFAAPLSRTQFLCTQTI